MTVVYTRRLRGYSPVFGGFFGVFGVFGVFGEHEALGSAVAYLYSFTLLSFLSDLFGGDFCNVDMF